MNNITCVVLSADFVVLAYDTYLSRLNYSILKALAFILKKILKTFTKTEKNRFTRLGAMAVLKLVATNRLDN